MAEVVVVPDQDSGGNNKGRNSKGNSKAGSVDLDKIELLGWTGLRNWDLSSMKFGQFWRSPKGRSVHWLAEMPCESWFILCLDFEFGVDFWVWREALKCFYSSLSWFFDWFWCWFLIWFDLIWFDCRFCSLIQYRVCFFLSITWIESAIWTLSLVWIFEFEEKLLKDKFEFLGEAFER